MNTIISSFAKLTACTAVLFGAPLLVASATNLYVVEVEKYLEYKACLVTAELDNSKDDCVR
jgi:hypothetical protein